MVAPESQRRRSSARRCHLDLGPLRWERRRNRAQRIPSQHLDWSRWRLLSLRNERDSSYRVARALNELRRRASARANTFDDETEGDDVNDKLLALIEKENPTETQFRNLNYLYELSRDPNTASAGQWNVHANDCMFIDRFPEDGPFTSLRSGSPMTATHVLVHCWIAPTSTESKPLSLSAFEGSVRRTFVLVITTRSLQRYSTRSGKSAGRRMLKRGRI